MLIYRVAVLLGVVVILSAALSAETSPSSSTHIVGADTLETASYPPFLSLSFSSKRDIPNTQATARFVINNRADKSEAVSQNLRQRTKTLLAALSKSGGKETRTDGFSIQPNMVYQDGKSSVQGYLGRVEIKTQATPETIGNLISTALNAGADEVAGVRLSPSDAEIEKVEEELTLLASTKALQLAEKVAGEIRCKVVRVLELSVEPSVQAVRGFVSAMQYNTEIRSSSDRMPIEEGQTTIERRVNLRVEILKK